MNKTSSRVNLLTRAMSGKNGIMGMGKIKGNNSTYNWDIKAGVYNAYVKETQLMLMIWGTSCPIWG